jgi:hypothetical protein
MSWDGILNLDLGLILGAFLFFGHKIIKFGFLETRRRQQVRKPKKNQNENILIEKFIWKHYIRVDQKTREGFFLISSKI